MNGYALGQILSSFGVIIVVFCFIVAVLAFLTPFFIFRIRNEIILLNNHMAQVITILGGPKPEKVATGAWLTCSTCRKEFRESELKQQAGRFYCPTCIPA